MVATYGWTLDEKGRALSKSLGNFIDPVAIMDQLGGDIVRLWVASSTSAKTSSPACPCSSASPKRSTASSATPSASSRRSRNLHRLQPRPRSDATRRFEQMQPIDQYILARTAELTGKITKAYADFEFHRVYHLSTSSVTPNSAPSTSTSSKTASTPTLSSSPATTISRLYSPAAAPRPHLQDHRRPRPPHRPHPQLHRRRGLPIPPRTNRSVHLTLFPNVADLVPGRSPGS